MGRILGEDVALVRDQAPLDAVIGEVVALRAAGGSTFKGLCPFHDEKTPSFQVDPDKGFWYCFGCSQGGDAIDFVRRHDGLTFTEAVEKLADIAGVTLRYEETDEQDASAYAHRRSLQRLVSAAHTRFQANFAELSDDHPARVLLAERGFTVALANQFEVGYAASGWTDMVDHLRQGGWSLADIDEAGMSVQGDNSLYDRFRHRLIWPIKDPAGKVIGFGGRKLDAEDRGPKYLNSPETPLYRKSHALYNLDVARKHVTAEGRVVIVEGYTDVMAFAAAGILTAIATCGTAFGSDHVTLLRRSIGDDGSFNGDIVFTFDGDAAGQKAAIKSFDLDTQFTRHTYVAAAPDGLDPCDLRSTDGDQALHAMLAARTPLVEFVLASALAPYDLSTPEGRAVALDVAAPILAKIRDDLLRNNYDRWVANRIGMEAWRVAKHVRQYTSRQRPERVPPTVVDAPPEVDPFTGELLEPHVPRRPEPGSAQWVERETLKCLVQQPQHTAPWYAAVEDTAYTSAAHLAIHRAVLPMLEAPDAGTRDWLDRIAGTSEQHGYLAELVLEPLTFNGTDEQMAEHCVATVNRLLDADAKRQIETLKADIAGLPPDAPEFLAAYQRLLALEEYRRQSRLRDG